MLTIMLMNNVDLTRKLPIVRKANNNNKKKKKKKKNGNFSGLHGVALTPIFAGRIGIWKGWFLWREENRSTRRKTLGAGTRTNNKLNSHMTLRPGIEPGSHWWEARVLTTAPSLHPYKL